MLLYYTLACLRSNSNLTHQYASCYSGGSRLEMLVLSTTSLG